ncbi:MAG: aminoacyl-tRNA hydrolase [Hyphomicrobium sp.]|nr:aminoacyl-tRNA hydrolase [Hyphomicrobium sp.]
MKLFVGLGNPGDKYSGNRHNIGFMAVETIARAHGFSPWRKKFNALMCEGSINGERVTLLKPETFMNDSGRAIGEAMRFLKIESANVVVFHDELDLLPGKLKVKAGGGNAGHNGLRSISAHIGNDYPRVRIGIGHPGSKDAVVHYVLNDFAKSERQWVSDMLSAIADAAGFLAKGDEARFLTEVARKTQHAGEADGGETDAPEKPQRAGKPPSAPAKPAKSGHPAGERANKRQSALADNLKKWLSARKSGE